MQARIPFGRCPLCESPELADSAKGDVSGHPLYHASLNRLVQWKRCAASGHVFTEGYFSDEALQLWLDVGFGNGSLLFTAQEYGFTPLGLDVRAQNVKALSALGIEAHCKDLSDLSLDAACSVISMADVLEHAPYPKKTLQTARRLLSAGGVLFVSMPNMKSMLWKAMDQQRANPYRAEIEH